MGTDVASFAKQLKEDGIDAARKEAEKIVADAKKEAGKILENAREEVEKQEKESEKRITQKRQNAEAEIRLVARDLMTGFRKNIEKIGCDLLKGKVAETLKDEDVIKNSISELLKTQKTGQEWELALGEKVGKPLANKIANLFKEKDAAVKLVDDLKKAGFEMRQVEGNEVIEVTEDSITESFKRLLSPELKKILQAQSED
ncbi:MAG: hypothetical protein ACQETH_02610 [Candidatus Rifleibacteriota bacterium]